MKKALLVVAHGSRRQVSNEEVTALTALLESSLEDDYRYVKSAFLELAEPSIPEGIHSLVEMGAEEIEVLPYFLSAGRHVSEDIPDIVKESAAKFPSVEIRLKSYIGGSAKMVEYIKSLLKEGA